MGVRTTIVMSEELLAAVRAEAGAMGWNLSKAIAELVHAGLHCRKPRRRGAVPTLPVVKGRMRPGVNLDDRDQLYDLMEGRR